MLSSMALTHGGLKWTTQRTLGMMPSFLAGAGGASLDVSTIAQCSLTKYVGHMSLQVLPALIYILYMYMYIYIYMYMYI